MSWMRLIQDTTSSVATSAHYTAIRFNKKEQKMLTWKPVGVNFNGWYDLLQFWIVTKNVDVNFNGSRK